MKTITYLKNNLSAHGCVAKRFKMLTYYVYAPLFHRFAPPIIWISQSPTCLLLNPNLIFQIGSNHLSLDKFKKKWSNFVHPTLLGDCIIHFIYADI
jgi:hypothetical protein